MHLRAPLGISKHTSGKSDIRVVTVLWGEARPRPVNDPGATAGPIPLSGTSTASTAAPAGGLRIYLCQGN